MDGELVVWIAEDADDFEIVLYGLGLLLEALENAANVDCLLLPRQHWLLQIYCSFHVVIARLLAPHVTQTQHFGGNKTRHELVVVDDASNWH